MTVDSGFCARYLKSMSSRRLTGHCRFWQGRGSLAAGEGRRYRYIELTVPLDLEDGAWLQCRHDAILSFFYFRRLESDPIKGYCVGVPSPSCSELVDFGKEPIYDLTNRFGGQIHLSFAGGRGRSHASARPLP